MDQRQTQIVLGIAAVVILLYLAIPLFGTREPPRTPTEPLFLVFDPASAMKTTEEFVTRYPSRVLGSIEARQSTGYLQQYFKQLGYEVAYAHFDAVLAGRRQVGRNVYAFQPGNSTEIIALIAHYDTARTTVQGAMDDGSGIGVLLELARVLAHAPTRRSLLFVASDGEEWGMLGAVELARNYPERKRFVAALSLDYVAVGDLGRLTLETSGQFGGYSPAWLRTLARGSIEAEGASLLEPGGFNEFIERALALSGTDQGPLLNAGIAAINLGSQSTNSALERSVYHSPQDTVGNLKVQSFARYGRVAERMYRTLDSLPLIPTATTSAFRVHGSIMLAPRVLTVLQYLAFLPLLAALWFHFANHSQYLSLGRIQRELSGVLATIFPFVLFYSSILLLTLLRRLPLFSLYPATIKDPVLEHPQYGALAGMILATTLAALGCYYLVSYLNRELPRPDFHVAKTILLLLLGAVSVCALLYNPFWAVTFLALPAWIWALVGPGSGPGGRAANRLMIVASGILYLMISSSFASRLQLGWKIIWYEVLALSTGVFTFRAFLLASAAVALGIRFLAIQSYWKDMESE